MSPSTSPTTAPTPRTLGRSARRKLGLGLVGLASLSLVVGCSTYGTTGSGGTTGAGPTGGASSGTGAGGSLATPSGGVNTTAQQPANYTQDGRTSGPAPVGTVRVPTPAGTGLEERSGTSPGGIGADSTGTPLQAGSGGVSATRAAVTGSNGGTIITVTPDASPGAMGTPTPTPAPMR